MEDGHKLKHMLEHWDKHNDEHIVSYLDWAKKAETGGNKALADALREIATESKKLGVLFKKAGELC